MKIHIVDKDDKLISFKERDSVNRSDIYRVAGLWITNTDNQTLLARRAFTKKQDPGKWGPAVAGTVEEGENYESNIIKEAEEEIGLKNIKPIKGEKEFVTGEHNFFVQWYYLKLNKDIKDLKFDYIEVAELRWFSKNEILTLVDSDEVLEPLRDRLRKLANDS